MSGRTVRLRREAPESEPVSLAPGWPWKVSVMDELESHYLDEVIYREAWGQRYRSEMGEREGEPGLSF